MAVILYQVAYPTALAAPSNAQIRDGLDVNGAAASWAGNATWTGSGQFLDASGLTASTAYKASAVVYDDVALEYSNVVTSAEWTTEAATVTHATTGVLVGPGGIVVGAAARTRQHATSGALVAPAASVSGSAARTRQHAASGALDGGASTLAGTAARTRAHATTGALLAGGAAVVGAAARTRLHATSGTLTGPGSAVVGAASRAGAPPDHQTTGALVGQGAAVAGSAARVAAAVTHATSGALTGAGATLDGVAAYNRAHAAVGALVAAAAAMAGAAVRTGPTVRFVTLRLLDKAEAGVTLPNLTGIRWAFYETTNPATWGAPVNQGDAVSTDGAGLATFEFPSTSLGAGDVGMLAATISDGDPAQSPPPRSFLIPVTLE